MLLFYCAIIFQAKAALMFDAVQVLVDSIARLLHKKPEILRKASRRYSANTSHLTECNPKGNLSIFHHGEKISRMIKRVRLRVRYKAQYFANLSVILYN